MNEHLGRASYVLSKGGTIMILNILQTANTVTVNLRGYMVIFFLLFLVYTKVKGETIRRTKVLKYIAAFLAMFPFEEQEPTLKEELMQDIFGNNVLLQSSVYVLHKSIYIRKVFHYVRIHHFGCILGRDYKIHQYINRIP